MTQRMLNANQATIYQESIDKFGAAFEYLGGTELTVAGPVMGAVFVEPKAMLIILGRITSIATTAAIPQLRFNDDEGLNYWHRNMSAAVGGATFDNTGFASQAAINLSRIAGTGARTFFAAVMNTPGKTHPCVHNHYEVTGSAATIGELEFGAGEWASTDLITNIQVRHSGTTDMGVESGFAIFGKDLT